MEFEKNRETWKGTYRQTAVRTPGSSVFRTQHSHYRGQGSTPGQGTKILQAAQWGKTEKEKNDSKTRKCNPVCLRDSSPIANFPQGKRYVVMSQT